MFVRIKNYLINTEEIAIINKEYTTGGETIVIRLKNQSCEDRIKIYFYSEEKERDAAFEFLSATLLKEEK